MPERDVPVSYLHPPMPVQVAECTFNLGLGCERDAQRCGTMSCCRGRRRLTNGQGRGTVEDDGCARVASYSNVCRCSCHVHLCRSTGVWASPKTAAHGDASPSRGL